MDYTPQGVNLQCVTLDPKLNLCGYSHEWRKTVLQSLTRCNTYD